MKRILFFSLFLAACSLSMNAEKTWAQYERYAASNDTVIARKRMPEYGFNKLVNTRRIEAVLMGNSITDNWAKFDPEFFIRNKFVGRGISGQTTAQMLSRFQADVIALDPKMVIIMAGTNDIAQNNGYISHEHILQNIQSMCELAKFHKIRPVLCSCLPAASLSTPATGWQTLAVTMATPVFTCCRRALPVRSLPQILTKCPCKVPCRMRKSMVLRTKCSFSCLTV